MRMNIACIRVSRTSVIGYLGYLSVELTASPTVNEALCVFCLDNGNRLGNERDIANRVF